MPVDIFRDPTMYLKRNLQLPVKADKLESVMRGFGAFSTAVRAKRQEFKPEFTTVGPTRRHATQHSVAWPRVLQYTGHSIKQRKHNASGPG